jgi:hypothetical protein
MVRVSTYLFMAITISMIVAAIPLALYNDNPEWLWMLFAVVFYLS